MIARRVLIGLTFAYLELDKLKLMCITVSVPYASSFEHLNPKLGRVIRRK